MSEKIISREVVTEWAERGRRSGRAMGAWTQLELGPPIKADLLALTNPLVDFIIRRGLAGVAIPMQDAEGAKDVNVTCYPLYEEIECVLDTWGSIYIEVDAATSRQRLADSHEALRDEVERLTEENAKLKADVLSEYDARTAQMAKSTAEINGLCAERERTVTVAVGTSCLTRDLVWCGGCGRGLSRGGNWYHCPQCGGRIDQESYRVACEEAERNGRDIARYISGEGADRIKAIEAELSALRTRLETETKRLDWLISQLNFKYDLDVFVETLVDSFTGESDHLVTEFRAAIDAAMSAAQPEEKPNV